MAKTKKMAFGGMGNMPTRGMGQAMSTNTRGPVTPGKPMPPGMAPGTRGQGTPMPPSQMQQAGAGIPAFAQQAVRGALGKPPPQLQASGPTPPPMPQYGAQTQMPPGRGLPNAAPGGMAPMGPGTQTGGPAPMGMAPPNAAQVGMFKKGGAVKAKAFAKGGSVKATSMGSVKTTKPKMGSASSRADGCAIRGKTRA